MSIGTHRRRRLTGSALGSVLAGWGRRGIVKSIQPWSIDLAGATVNTALLTAVDVANTVLVVNGSTKNFGAGSLSTQGYARVTLTNSTTVTATRGATQAGAFIIVGFAIEFFPGVLKSVQYDSVALAGGTSQPKTITSVNAKAFVLSLGWSTTSAAVIDPTFEVKHVLTDPTTVTATIQTGNNATTTSFVVVEPY